LAVCAGAGAAELAMRLAAGASYRTVCYVERELTAAACLVRGMESGVLDQAPVWTDLATFDGRAWRGGGGVVPQQMAVAVMTLAGLVPRG
jgi:DNA (cytosine-5)-methyltransferase 1